MSSWEGLSGVTPSRVSVYRRAREARDAAQMAMEMAIDGPNCDTRRALEYLKRAKAIIGPLDGQP